MAVSGPLNTQIAILMLNKLTVLIQHEAGWIPEPFWALLGRENIFTKLWTEPRISGSPALKLVSINTFLLLIRDLLHAEQATVNSLYELLLLPWLQFSQQPCRKQLQTKFCCCSVSCSVSVFVHLPPSSLHQQRTFKPLSTDLYMKPYTSLESVFVFKRKWRRIMWK
jgi:hypothetical protein